MAKVVMVKADGKTVNLRFCLPVIGLIPERCEKYFEMQEIGDFKRKGFRRTLSRLRGRGHATLFPNLYDLEVWVYQVLAEDKFIVFRQEAMWKP